jgi:hypothetical protein
MAAPVGIVQGVKMNILNEEERFPSFTPGVKYT